MTPWAAIAHPFVDFVDSLEPVRPRPHAARNAPPSPRRGYRHPAVRDRPRALLRPLGRGRLAPRRGRYESRSSQDRKGAASVPRSNERRSVTHHPRRRVLSLAAGAAALPAVSRISWAQAYPTRPVRIIASFAAGGGADITARLIGQSLSERLGQAFIIENRPGADGNIAA